MDVSYLQQSNFILTPIRYWTHRPLFVLPRISISVHKKQKNVDPFRCRNMCSASTSTSETLVTGSRKEDGKSREVVSKKEDEFGDLKSWMHKNGLPPCKVFLKERHSHDSEHRSIHYVAASEDLQAGDVAFSVPNPLVVTLERVLGNETIGKVP
ncbi:unnamed protein product [Ilex paraguariensis]|uniref:Uncharacterized protein n=1 Tax=Ilex paraguariensis TaxID=185542 RepID=A0ABC8UVW4_9AQUA